MSRLAYWLCAALILAAAILYYPKWTQPNTEATLSWDVSGYYLYLPAALIYKDITKLNWWNDIEQKYHPGPGLGQAFQHPSGSYVMKYPMGQALQFLPWFAAAHLLAQPLGYPADGFSLPYQAAISWGSLLVALIGLWFLRRVLKVYFSDNVVAAVLISIVFGTNYLEYASITGAMTHNWLFTLYALLIFITIRFYQTPSLSCAAAIGLLVGWATLTRPTEIIVALIPVLWGVGSWAALRERLLFFKKHFSKIALAATATVGVVFLQMAYWKYATGEWLVYSYQEQGFSWLRPHFSNVLWSARAGWMVYSPMMIFAVVGLISLRKRWPAVFPTVLALCLIALYITAAWDIWWYGGSLGQRAMVQSYTLWAFGLAAFWQLVARSSRWLAAGISVLAGVFIYLNLWWSHQAHKGGLFASEQMTKAYMLKVLGRFEAEREWLKLLDTTEEFEGAERRNTQEVYFNNFENDSTGVTLEAPIAGSKSLILSKEIQFSPEFHAAFGDRTFTAHSWVRASVAVRCDPKEWNWWQMTQYVMRFYREGKIVKERMIRLQRHVDGGEVKTIYFDTKIPFTPGSTSTSRPNFDDMAVFFWNAGSDKTIRLDDLRVEVFE